MKILIVDDEEAIRDSLSQKLTRAGFQVSTAANGLEGLRTFHTERPDVVVLDIAMPEMDGLTVCQRIREVAETPIMMLSAQAVTEVDIIEGLNAGADEYLMKPIRGNEFVARVQALLRRAQMTAVEAESGYNDGYLSVDLQRRHVHVNGEKRHLTPTEFKLLAVLLENSGRVVPQRELLEQVWGKEYIDDIYYPRVYISQLRRKIEPDAANPTYIQTEHRVGYRFEKQKRQG
ncbi:MAG: DNA-binding response regulator [Chloroflexi bacterium]|nr:DNA-binding response regulator [Chloroflexota bacterium]MBZ0317657.1 response regulator transcription factor [Anaerolineae bacterium]MCQ3929781.1 DNA-binding response regulator [Chloroflexota bacterium]NOG64553.1 response regulator transcription factor [Chloroflexota bacterium]GIK63448.1 MAG: DNA-binding response regulator [Chloroflexota bacterium]